MGYFMPKIDKRTKCPVQKYAEQVVKGKIVAGHLMIKACERHLEDLKQGHKRGLTFDREASEHAIGYFSLMRHTKGEWAGKPIKLAPNQKFIVGSLFGWKGPDGYRRFKYADIEVARKFGKSTLAGGIANYLLTSDGEGGAEIYTAATKRDQARIVFDQARNMLRRLPRHYALAKRVQTFNHSVLVPDTDSMMVPLSSDSKTMDGLNPHGVIMDEVHAYADRGVNDVLVTALGARNQFVVFRISTAGYDPESLWAEERDYAEKVLNGVIEDDALFVFIAAIDDDDDPFDESCWIKANPNLGVTPKIEYLRSQAKKAKEQPSFYNEFLRLHLNQWTQTNQVWMPVKRWDAIKGPAVIKKRGLRKCYIAADLATRTDIAAKARLFTDDDDGIWKLDFTFWMPEDEIVEKGRKHKAPYQDWASHGHIITTPGNMVDQDFIEHSLFEDASNYDVQAFGLDPWNAAMMIAHLMNENLPVKEFRQGFASMAPATKEYESLILKKKIQHDGNPVARWMFANLIMKRDPAGNMKPDKSLERKKIDGQVAAIMATGLAVTDRQPSKTSVYEKRGLIGV